MTFVEKFPLQRDVYQKIRYNQQSFMRNIIKKRLKELGKEHVVHQVRRVASAYTYDAKTICSTWLQTSGGDVLFIQGYLGCLYPFVPLGNALHARGYRVHYVDMPTFNTTKPVQKIAQHFVDYILTHNLNTLSIVGHSKGGIIAKYILKHYPEVGSRIRKVVTIATPHRGARWTNLPFPGMREISPHSPLLTDLAHKEIEEKIVAICNTSDLLIHSENEKTEHGTNHIVDVWGHKNIMFHPDMIARVISTLSQN